MLLPQAELHTDLEQTEAELSELVATRGGCHLRGRDFRDARPRVHTSLAPATLRPPAPPLRALVPSRAAPLAPS